LTSMDMAAAGTPTAYREVGDRTPLASGSTQTTAGAGTATNRGATQPIITAVGLKIRATAGSGCPVRPGRLHGWPGEAAAAMSDGRRSGRRIGAGMAIASPRSRPG